MAPTDGFEAEPGRPAGAGPRGEPPARGETRESLLAILPAGCWREFMAPELIGHLKTAAGQALVLLPSRRMAGDIREFLVGATDCDTIGVITGNVSKRRRERLWDGVDIVCATAEMFDKDMERGIVSPDQFGLAVLVGAHQAVGMHAYAKAARSLAGAVRIVAVTDALPRRPERRAEMIGALRTTRVEGRAGCGPDGPPRRARAVEYVRVDLPPDIAAVRDGLRRAIHDACVPLRESGYGELEDPPLSRLEGMLEAGAPPEAARGAAIVRCMLDTLEAHGPAPFLELCEWCRGLPGVDMLLDGPLLAGAIDAARAARDRGLDHPKMDTVVGMLAAPGRVLVVVGQDGSAPNALRRLKAAGTTAARLPPGADMAGAAYAERAEAVDGLRAGRYRVLVSVSVEDAYSGAGGGSLVPGDVDLVVCCAGGAEEASAALGRGADRAAALVTSGSAEDPDRWAADQMDWKTHMAIEKNRVRAPRDGGGAGLAAQDGEQPEYRLLRRHGEEAALGPAGAAGTFVEAAGERDEEVRALLGESIYRSSDLTLYAVHDSRPAGERSRGTATWGQKAAPYKMLNKLDSPGRNVCGVPIEAWRDMVSGQITKEDYTAIMRALGRALRTDISPRDWARNWLTGLVHSGIRGQGGTRMALYATEDNLLYNGPADGPPQEGHRKILDYMTVREIRGGKKILAIWDYVESVVARVMAETGDSPEFAE